MSEPPAMPQFPGTSPLLTVDEVAWWFSDVSARAVVDRITEGKLRAVDISVAGGKAKRREYRVFRTSIDRPRRAPQSSCEPIEALLPQNRTSLRRDEVGRLLNCTRRHVANLPIPGAGAAGVPTMALAAFLSGREVKSKAAVNA